MIAGLEDDQVLPHHEVHESVLVRDAAGPRARRPVLQLFGLPNAGERLTKRRSMRVLIRFKTFLSAVYQCLQSS